MQSTQPREPAFFGLSEPLPRPLAELVAERARDAGLRLDLPWIAPSLAERAADAAPKAAGEVGAVHRLLLRTTMGPNQAEIAAAEEAGYGAWLSYQLRYEEIDDGPLEEALARFLPTLAAEPLELIRRYRDEPQRPIVELVLASMLRALYSPRQLFERMVIFWSDHFNIHLFDAVQGFFKPTDDREVIRRHAMGSFPDLLRASAHSPSMLIYLTNDSNHKDHPNENYARELMELHTLGADNGYTQEDVREVARCFTGWTFWRGEGGGVPGRFRFDRSAHDTGRKVVLGHEIPAGGGVEDGERVLTILAEHPETARFIARKLLVYLWGYEPPERYVERVAASYRANGGDIRSMLRVILKQAWLEGAPAKLKRPFHLVISALRATSAGLGDPGYLVQSLLAAGHVPFNWAPPNGYPDSEGYWGGLVLPRWNFGATVFDPRASGVELDVPLLDPAVEPWKLARRIDWLLTHRTLSERSRKQLRDFLEAEPVTPQRVQEALGLAVSSAEFQSY